MYTQHIINQELRAQCTMLFDQVSTTNQGWITMSLGLGLSHGSLVKYGTGPPIHTGRLRLQILIFDIVFCGLLEKKRWM